MSPLSCSSSLRSWTPLASSSVLSYLPSSSHSASTASAGPRHVPFPCPCPPFDPLLARCHPGCWALWTPHILLRGCKIHHLRQGDDAARIRPGWGAAGYPSPSVLIMSQYKDSFFKVPTMNRWVVVITGPRLLEELRKIPDERLSFDHAMQDVRRYGSCYPFSSHNVITTQLLQVKYTFGLEAQEHPYHVQVIRDHLKRNLSQLFPDIFDEIRLAFDESIPYREAGEWSHG